MQCYGSNKWKWSIQRTNEKSSRSILENTHLPNFELLDARITSALNRIIQNSHFKKKVSLEEQEAQKEDRFPRGRQIAFMIYDYFRVTGAHDTVLGYADLFSFTLRNDNVQVFGTRCDYFLMSMTKIPSDDVLESLYKLRIRESDQLKTVEDLFDMEIHQKISMPNSQKLVRFRNFDCENLTPETGKLRQDQWVRVAGISVVLREEKELAISGKQKASVREETNRHQKPLHPLSHQHQEVEVRREKGASEAEASLGSPSDSRAKTS